MSVAKYLLNSSLMKRESIRHMGLNAEKDFTFFRLFLIFFLLSFSTISYLEAQITAIQYYNQIVEEHAKVFKKNKRFITTIVHTEKSDEVDRYRKEIIIQIDSSLAILQRLSPFKSDDKLRKETIEILKREREVYNMDFKEVVQLKKNSSETFDAMEKFFTAEDKAEAKVNQMLSDLRTAQERFAQKNHLTVQEDKKMKAQIEKIARLNLYSEKIFLIYFRAFRDFNLMAEAINSKKAEAIEKARLQLMVSSSEGLAQLRSQGPFESDSTYIGSGINLLVKYETLAKGDMMEVTRLLKEPDKLTNADVSKINSVLMYINNEPEVLSLEFQNQERKLYQKHVPKD